MLLLVLSLRHGSRSIYRRGKWPDARQCSSSLGAGYFACGGISGISGSFAEGGYATTLTGAHLEVNGNASTGVGNYEDVFLFDSGYTGSIGISEDPALLGYALATS